MSNPCINRWGLNSFWHHYWYSDYAYSSNLKQDRIFIDLIQTYLAYGSAAPADFFWNRYWYKTNSAPAKKQLQDYYRWITVSSSPFQMTNTYRLRIASEEVFQTRISVLRFDSWIIINFYWFQFDKKKKRRSLRTISRDYTHAENSSTLSHSPLKKLRSLATLSNYSSSLRRDYYNF
jgi:hypothetical protein